jgi:NADH-quinone oxidoreductase subunit G
MSDGDGLVTLTIDGAEVSVPKGTLIIRAAEEVGVEIPRFCDHPLLDPVAACRQCYVKVEGQRKLMTSCSTPVADGMKVFTQFTDDEVRKAQVSVLEFLLINHPLDCPVCDRGGECPLQDQALAFGPGASRYEEAKRTYRKPLPLSPLVNLDRERCVLCARCTRFCDEISGDRFIELFDRGGAEQVGISAGQDFRSPFSGNTIQICPVGALTATTYRFAARPFDVSSGDTICPHCAAGCNLRVDLRRGQVVRQLARDNLDVNDAWACDKGRFAFSFADQPTRLTTPLLRDHGLEPASFDETLAAVATWCRGGRAAVLAGGRLSDEDAYALSKLARTALRTNDVDARPFPCDPSALPAEQVQATDGMAVTYRDVERAKLIVVVGLDAEQELPILHLRIRKAARRGARVVVIHPRRTRLYDLAEHVLTAPGSEAAALADLDPTLAEAGSDAVVLAGSRSLQVEGLATASMELAARTGAQFALVARRANDTGALVAGLHPALLPGGRAVEDDADRSAVAAVWGEIPSSAGRGTAAILEAAAAREIDVLFLVGTDPLRDFPDAALARRALENVRYKVVVDIDQRAMEIFADAMLPAAPYLEKDGHYTDWEGRSQRLRPVRSPFGLARSEWEIFQHLSEAMGADMGFHSLDDLHREMATLVTAPEAEVGRVPPRREREVRGGASPHSPPPVDGELILFTYPLLIDEGSLLVGADLLKQALEEDAFVEINPADAERLGVEDGSTVVLRTEAGRAEVTVRVTGQIAAGVVFVPWNQPGLAANILLSGSPITTVAVEVPTAVPA